MRAARALLLAAALAFAAEPAIAAPTPNSVVTPQTPNNGLQNFVQGTDATATYKTVYTAGGNGSKCVGLIETNNDGSATHLVTIAITNGGTDYVIVAVTTASNDGNGAGVPPKNLLATSNLPGLAIDSDGMPYLILKSGDTLRAQYSTSLTLTTRINLVATCADF